VGVSRELFTLGGEPVTKMRRFRHGFVRLV
jgi:hypothetical protein